MKPLKLTMTAFESYLEKTEIDFTQLEEAGVFLIWGNTGAGKTTIFDAISYALFGRLSQDQKENAEMIKTIDASPSVKCEVSLEFEEKNKRYLVTRIPRQINEKGKETTSKVTLTCLSSLEGNEIKGEGNVNAKIGEIIGLTAKQFYQTTLIAQGSFARILVADTKDRIEIFRTLFGTYFYSDFVSKLAEKKKSVEENSRFSRDLLESCYKKISVLPEDEQQKQQIFSDEERTLYLEKTLKFYQEKSLKFDVEKKEAEQEESRFIKEKLEADNHEKDIKDFSIIEQQISQKEQESKQKKDKYDSLCSQENNYHQMHDYCALLVSKLSQYQELDNLQKEYRALHDECNLLDNQIDKEQINLNQIISSKDATNNKINEIKNQTSQIDSIVSKINLLDNKYKNLDSDIENANELKHELIRKKYLYDFLLEKKNEVDLAREEDNRVYQLYFHSLSGVVAKELLKEGQPCPVCGSLNHPKIASDTIESVSKEEYETVKQDFETKRSSLEQTNGQYETICSGVDKQFSKLTSSIKQYEISYDSSKEREEIVDSISYSLSEIKNKNQQVRDQLQEQYDALCEAKKSLVGLEFSLEKLTTAEAEYQKKVQVLSIEFAKKQEMKNNVESQKNKIQSQLEFESISKAQEEIERLTDAEKNYLQLKNEADKAFKTCTEELAKLLGRKDEVNQRIQSYSGRELELIKNDISAVSRRKEQIEIEAKKLYTNIMSIQTGLKDYQEELNKSLLIRKNFDIYLKLYTIFSATSNREVQNKYNIEKGESLETFVLAYYLDRILERASKRLMKMSDGQYRLVRRAEEGKVGQVGLGIDVVDCLTNCARNAGSLSGGETFIASLALALGLSDYVRESTGGTRVETLFIDEGFGNLDRETLERVVETISTLATEGNCTIGLISHVEELYGRFSSKILVNKDQFGHSHLSCKL